jgi:hypothetical protein
LRNVTSAADGHTTIFDMLDGRYIDKKIQSYYENPSLYLPLVYIGLGVARRFDDVPPALNGLAIPLEKPVTIAGKEYNNLNIFIYSYDPTLADEGKTVIIVSFETDYGF